MNAGALCRARDVVGRVRGREHLVDDVDEPVAGDYIRHGDIGVVDHHAVAHHERQRLSVGGIGHHAIRDVGGWNFSAHNMVEQNVGKGGFALGSVECSEVNACVGEGLVRGGKDGERSVTLEGWEQVGLNDGGDQ